MKSVTIYRKNSKKKVRFFRPSTGRMINAVYENDLSPADRAKLQELRAALKKASDEMDANPDEAKYEKAYLAAEDTYNDFVEKVTSK